MTSICKVSGCRFSHSHVTRGHKCGVCKKYGHGEIECGNHRKQCQLSIHYNDTVSKPCAFAGCKYSQYHTTDAHHCTKCNERYHTEATCPQNRICISCPLCKQSNNIPYNQVMIYGSNDKCCICLDNNVQIYVPSCGHACVCNECFLIMTGNTNNIQYLKKDLINKVNSMLKSYPSYIIIPCDMGSMIYVKRVGDNNPIQELMIGPDDVHISSDFINGYALVENTLKVVNQL